MRSIIGGRVAASLTLFLSLILTAAACGDDDDTAAIQAGLDTLVADEVAQHGFLGAGVSVRLADGRELATAAGHSDPAGAAVYDVATTEQVIGSTTKLYTAVLVMQLVEQGRIGLDAPVNRWLSFQGAGDITVRMLLDHTSGLSDYLNLLTLPQLGQPWTPTMLLDVAVAAGPMGAPGMAKAIYSNTNYLVLAMIVEAETGASWAENVATRIAAPLGLEHTYYAGERERAAHIAGGWLETDAGWLNTLTLFDPSVGWAVGAMVSTNVELRRFTEALFDSELFESPATLAQMRDFATEMDPAFQSPGEPPSRVGLAITSMTSDGLTLEGHLGHIEGYNAAALHDPETGALIVVTSNDDRAMGGPLAFKVARYLRDAP
jgi:D-alanyl-D-alanine carboxypeptidase